MKSAPPARLTVLASPDTQAQGTAGSAAYDSGSAAYDFGHVGGGSRSPIVHTFLLRNDGSRPLTLDHLQPSCGCTSASLPPTVPLRP